MPTVRVVYFEDLRKGAQPGSSQIVVDGLEMLEYNLKYDPLPCHIDEVAAKDSGFRGVIASGGYTSSLACLLAHNVYHRSEYGSVNLVANRGRSLDEQSTKLSRVSVSTRDNLSRCVVVSQVYVEPTRHRRPDGGAQCDRILRIY